MDGGPVALIGFLYQMIGTLALHAWAECPRVPAENADLDALLGVIRSGEYYHERDDIDAMALALAQRLGVDQPDACVLMQFKYSQRPNIYPVIPSDLVEISRNFLRGMQQWSKEQRSITSYRIITNRRISPTVKRLIHKLQGQRQHRLFKESELNEVLQKVEIITDLDFSTWIDALKHFANEYGVLPDEFEHGIHQMIGSLVARASAGDAPSLRKEDLIKSFRGYEGLRKLTVAAIREHTSEDWNELKENLGIHGRETLVRRELLEKARNMLREHALVIFSGSGGNGKSVMTWHLLRSMLDETAETAGSTTAFLPAWHVQPKMLSWVVGDLAGIPENERHEHMERALQRVHIANPTSQPVICLGLDGLDENNVIVDYRSTIHEVVTWFWRKERELQQYRDKTGSVEPPEATLIITCRDSSTIIDDVLQGTFSFEMRKGLTPLEIMDYSHDELIEAVEQMMQFHVDRFRQTLFPESFVGTSLVGTTFTPVYKETLDALHHPAMWLAVQDLSFERQALLLDGNAQALNHLAEGFLFWFYQKLKRRCPDWDPYNIMDTLEAVALQANNLKIAQFPRSIWKEAGHRGYGLEGRQVERLCHEALSAGLIHEEKPQRIWYWRHPFIGRYLAQKAQEGW